MVQPQYSPQEALDRIKLMMKYDTSKTLNENVETIKQPVNEALPLVPLVGAGISWLAGILGTSSVVAGTAAAGSLAGIGTWIYNTQGGTDAFSKTQTFFQGCSSLDSKLKPTQNKSAHREAADKIYNAIEGFGTTLGDIKSAISSMESVADLCAMYKYYNKTYGDLYDDLDSDIDGEDFRKYVWSAIAPIVDDAAEDLEDGKKEDGKKTDDGKKKVGGGGGGTGYKPCSGTYSFGCKSDVIAKVQACIGTTADGKFGPKTKAALTSKGFSSFTDADVEKICKTVVVAPKPKDEFVTQVDADDAEEILNM
jgi:hypothetical protein